MTNTTKFATVTMTPRESAMIYLNDGHKTLGSVMLVKGVGGWNLYGDGFKGHYFATTKPLAVKIAKQALRYWAENNDWNFQLCFTMAANKVAA